MIIEEGLSIEQLRLLLNSLATSARHCEIRIAAGDTKVVARGEAGGLYLATTGIGIRPAGISLDIHSIQPGDAVLVSGPIGDHGTTVLLARENYGLDSDLKSDSAPVLDLCQALLDFTGLRFMRDPTRGGLATVMHEIRHTTGYGIELNEIAIPRHDAVQSVCEILGYDPLYLACEGRVVAIIDQSQADAALSVWQQMAAGKQAAIIGQIDRSSNVMLRTLAGGQRMLLELEDDPLPRIC